MAAASFLGLELNPKKVIIFNTLLVVVATAIAVRVAVRFWGGSPPESGSLAKAGQAAPQQMSGGSMALASRDFGDPGETRRDACRAFCAGSVYCQPEGAATATPLKPPAGLPPGVEASALAVQHDALAAALRSQLGVELPTAAFKRLLPMLTVNPALSALSAAGELPMVLQNRFVVQARRGEGGRMGVHALMMGFVGTPLPGGAPNQKAAPHLLIVDSPSLLDLPDASDDPLGYQLRYSIRKALHTSIDRELPGALAAPPSGLP